MQTLAQRRNVGLKILTSFPPKEALLSSPSSPIMISNNIALPPNCDDHIGNESCMDLQMECHIDHCDTSKSNDAPSSAIENQTKAKSSSSTKKEKKVFPPPIPLLARTQNLASHMPWVLKRYYTSEGRLILKEEKVRHHEYFRAHRANGRLTLQLVPLDDNEDDDDYMFLGTSSVKAAATSPHHEEINKGSHDNNSTIKTNRFAGEDKASIVANDMQNNDNGVVGDTNGGLKCWEFNGVKSPPSCIFGVRVQPIRTVHG